MLEHRTAGGDVHREVAPSRAAANLNGIRRGRERHGQRREARCPAVNLHFHAGRSCLNRDRAGGPVRCIPLILPGGSCCRCAAEHDHADPLQRRDGRAPIARRAGLLHRARHSLLDRNRTERHRDRFGAERIEAVNEGVGKRDSRLGRSHSLGAGPKSSNSYDRHCFLLPPVGSGSSGRLRPGSHWLACRRCLSHRHT